MSARELALKVDVDTELGSREGVPRLLDILDRRGVKASFYLSLGPDNSGRAIKRLFTRPGFLKKMLRTKAPSTYGFRTMLLGTLLPAPIIGRKLGGVVKRLQDSGHEVGLHAWDHVTWHDTLWKMSEEEVQAEVERGIEAFTALTGCLPDGFAAPAWRICAEAIKALKQACVKYTSATRGTAPYFPSFAGHRLDLLEIPTTLPTADEVLGVGGINAGNLGDFYFKRAAGPGLHVLTIHAEMEGRGLAESFERLLDGFLGRDYAFVRLIDVAEEHLGEVEAVPCAEVITCELPGRAGRVSHQGP